MTVTQVMSEAIACLPHGKNTVGLAHHLYWIGCSQNEQVRINCLFRDLRATRAWFNGREAGRTPAERVRRDSAQQC